MDEHIEAVQRMQDYIAQNLSANITMADLSVVSRNYRKRQGHFCPCHRFIPPHPACFR